MDMGLLVPPYISWYRMKLTVCEEQSQTNSIQYQVLAWSDSAHSFSDLGLKIVHTC